MKDYLRLLVFESRTRWLLLFFPLIYLFFLPVFLTQQSGAFSLTPAPIFFFVFQSVIMAYPIFQNSAWGIGDYRLASLEFSFVLASSRVRLYWAKAALYLLASLSFGLSFVAFAAFHPSIELTVPYRTAERAETMRAFYLGHFPGAQLVKDKEDRQGNKYDIILPHGRWAVAFHLLTACLAFALFYQVIMAFLPEKRGANFLAILLVFCGCFALVFTPLLGKFTLLWDSSGLASGQGIRVASKPLSETTTSLYEQSVAFLGQHWLAALAVLLIVTAAVQLFCCRRFVRKEIP